MDNQQGPTVEHMELCSVLCGILDSQSGIRDFSIGRNGVIETDTDISGDLRMCVYVCSYYFGAAAHIRKKRD